MSSVGAVKTLSAENDFHGGSLVAQESFCIFESISGLSRFGLFMQLVVFELDVVEELPSAYEVLQSEGIEVFL